MVYLKILSIMLKGQHGEKRKRKAALNESDDEVINNSKDFTAAKKLKNFRVNISTNNEFYLNETFD
jgi:hypothetical protein